MKSMTLSQISTLAGASYAYPAVMIETEEYGLIDFGTYQEVLKGNLRAVRTYLSRDYWFYSFVR